VLGDKMKDISLNQIIGPWTEPFLEASIESVRPILDAIILVDTAPGRNPNRERMEAIPGVTILELPRGKDKDFSYADARNLARKATKTKWLLRLDADEVIHQRYLDELLEITRTTDSIAVEVRFWHHVLHPDLYQVLEDDIKKILLMTDEFEWVGKVHECPTKNGDTYKAHHIKMNHYGYVRGQREVFKRWQLYRELGGMPHNLDELNPDDFLSDMELVCKVYPDQHPKAIVHKLLEMYPDLGNRKSNDKS
jgi:hypothetical protein